MNIPPDISSVIPASMIQGDDPAETGELLSLLDEAISYLEAQAWCNGIVARYFGCGVSDILGVFFFEITPADVHVDTFLWVIVGDLPPLHIVTDRAKTPVDALYRYIEVMGDWVEAVENGAETGSLPPTGIPPTAEHASLLDKRLSFIQTRLMGHFQGLNDC